MNQKFFDDLPQDLLKDVTSASDAIFDAFNDCIPDVNTIKTRNNYVKSLFKSAGFKKEINVDNSSLSTFFSSSENATTRSQGFYTDDEEEKLVEIRFIIHNLLPDFERDIMVLIFDHSKIQEDIGVILGLSQEMVNYYKKRAIRRILHFYQNRKINVDDMRECLLRHMSKRQLEAMMLYFFKHNQRVVSKELGISQSAVSARLKQGLKKLKKKSKNDEKALEYYKIFDNLTKQKSLYCSQTKMKAVNEVDNYVELDKDQVIVLKTPKKKRLKKLKIKRLSTGKKPHKKIQFNRTKFKSLRNFFKR